ncbi:prephenate dehydrogenase [Candidatus Koribacter versatilis Ellin345]|uniref:Prephenate dehydrogenase n=1 Tax=Koribacter versatilis (strain Ellin345) TaxID=204669 RepID=Q1ISI5_KORVE|nr:prephenate dehydrogenase/arogenate dehydrogenase family protein [Candidatus Koribacter versatilis]ABF40165.1 prephenate dehydrogenase [Candidatus Koribacter versatilis Ellin345]
MTIQRITIAGLGLIGGSLALALRKAGFDGELVGCDRAEVIATATERGVIDSGNIDPVTAAQGSNVVVLATPVGAIIDLIERLGPVVPASTLLTDVGSTKHEIAERAQQVFGSAAGARFLPSHPMAGAEHCGLEHANADLFRGAPWVFTLINGQPEQASHAAEWISLVEKLGAIPVFFDAVRHDRLIAWSSHLPQMVSTALASALEAEFGDDPAIRQICGRGLNDMTRLAASGYPMWRDIVATNSNNLRDALLKYEQQLSHLRENLRGPALREEFDAANRFRKNLKS